MKPWKPSPPGASVVGGAMLKVTFGTGADIAKRQGLTGAAAIQ